MHFKSSVNHVLVIDDDPIVAEVLKAFFEARGVERVTVAGNGHLARSIVDEAPDDLDLVSCDLNMPEFDGVEFLMHLREASIKVPIMIVSSAHETIVKTAEILARSYGLNYLGAVLKPVDEQGLETLLASLLEDRSKET
ncbi:MAG: hypothetical protein RLZ98_172 [Pseudomonadota bacterium]|jgi:CheY-like chemotaxis protein